MNNLEQLKKQYKALWEEIEKLKNSEIDFSKWICRNWNVLAIKWEKLLKSFKNWDVFYSNNISEYYKAPITYTHTTLDKLEKNDVFICEDSLYDICIVQFNIFKWKDDEWECLVNFLDTHNWIEIIKHYSIVWNPKVIKFNRY